MLCDDKSTFYSIFILQESKIYINIIYCQFIYKNPSTLLFNYYNFRGDGAHKNRDKS